MQTRLATYQLARLTALPDDDAKRGPLRVSLLARAGFFRCCTGLRTSGHASLCSPLRRGADLLPTFWRHPGDLPQESIHADVPTNFLLSHQHKDEHSTLRSCLHYCKLRLMVPPVGIEPTTVAYKATA